MKQFGTTALRKFIGLLTLYLSTTLNERQKRDFVRNLLQETRRDGTIRPVQARTTKRPVWELARPTAGATIS